jgi:hypothetical protein
MNTFSELLSLIKNGMKITLTKDDCVPYDDFLIFGSYRREQTITIHTNRVPFWIEFDGDEPMRLEDCPTSFLETLIANIKKGNYKV